MNAIPAPVAPLHKGNARQRPGIRGDADAPRKVAVWRLAGPHLHDLKEITVPEPQIHFEWRTIASGPLDGRGRRFSIMGFGPLEPKHFECIRAQLDLTAEWFKEDANQRRPCIGRDEY